MILYMSPLTSDCVVSLPNPLKRKNTVKFSFRIRSFQRKKFYMLSYASFYNIIITKIST